MNCSCKEKAAGFGLRGLLGNWICGWRGVFDGCPEQKVAAANRPRVMDCNVRIVIMLLRLQTPLRIDRSGPP